MQVHAGLHPPLAPDAIRAEMERVLANPAFQASPRRRDLLRYIVEETLAGRADRLKGFGVGVAVFGRDASFDPQADPVVRLEARRLRRDLDSYYGTVGGEDAIRITVPKGGYVPHFEPMAQAADPPAPDRAEAGLPDGAPQPPVTTPAPMPPARAFPAARLRLVAALLVAACLAGIGGWAWLRGAAPPEAGGPAVLVLPFQALSTREDDRFLASGMTQELIGQLMRFPEFRLFSTPASFAQSPGADPIDLGVSLGAAYVVHGVLRSDPAALHVRAQLTEVATSEVVWSGTYDRPPTSGDLFAVQGAISTEIATTLGQPYGVVPRMEAERLSRATTPSLSSHLCVMRAYDYRRSFRLERFGPVRACLEAAVAREPDYADAWAMLGWLHLDAGRFDWAPEGRDRAYADAIETASRAVAVDPQSTRALQALAASYFYAGRYDESEALMRRALELNPNDPDAMAQFGWRLAVRGKFDEGVPLLQRAIDRTLSPPGWYFHLIAVHHYLKGDYAAMLAAAERSAVDGSAMSQSFIAIAEGALGRGDAARRALDRLALTAPGFIRDPAAAYRVHHPADAIVEALVAGLREAGWTAPQPIDTGARDGP